MEFEIQDDPQGERDDHEGDRDGGIVEDHIALKNQSSVKADDYPTEERKAQSLVTPKSKK
ncbi:hypothetical protein E3U23_03020 [Erythrobacter litoralis]|uniref:hypothetical protein n=1 Tax=Erythrobacter litoralis TaxID=39960 RepID=UPI002435A338|nr:hypothetical protein [Erythrobacter litoralis]MDG6078160.1 hypothetical protein [Erythrobacter litoralis]